MTRPIIQLENVWKTYQMGEVNVHALRGIDLKVKEGEFLAITGASGSGKSTMVSLIGSLDLPSKGKINLRSRNISHMSESDLSVVRGKTIGFVFQQFNLMPTLTALENVMLPMMFQRKTKEERVHRAETLLKRLDLGDRMHHRPGELSGGQQQRVAIARSLANDPPVIIADEPTGNLDSKTGKDIMKFLLELHNEGKTVVMVTHDVHLAPHADRIVHLLDGKIAKEVRNGKGRHHKK